ncbi:MAG: 30S ribosomal protein S27e [Candidatus Njordarchaeota archaeon]
MAEEIKKIIEELDEKEREIARFPESTFIRVKCKNCGHEIITFSHASTKVLCPGCNEVLVEPTGGKAKIRGEILNEYYF